MILETSAAFLIEAIGEAVKKAVNKTADSAQSGDIVALQAEESRQEVAMRMAERQAKVAQEIAIAKRIEVAVEVEIEEFYDSTAEGSIGATTDGEILGLGARGRSGRVVKRTYKFKGGLGSTTSPRESRDP